MPYSIHLDASSVAIVLADNHQLQDKVAIVMGSASGIGKATILCFYKEGAHVIFTGCREDLGEQLLQEEITTNGNKELSNKCLFVKADHTWLED